MSNRTALGLLLAASVAGLCPETSALEIRGGFGSGEGPDALPALVGSLPALDRHVTIQPIRVLDSGGTAAGPTQAYFESAIVPAVQKIWRQAGIGVEFVGTWNTFTSDEFFDINASGLWGEHVDLFGDPGHGQNPNNQVVNLWFVRTITAGSGSGLDALGVSLTGQNGMALANRAFSAGRLDVAGHELGHVLGLNHGPWTTDYLMHSATLASTALVDIYDPLHPLVGKGYSKLDTTEIEPARSSRFAVPDSGLGVLPLLVFGSLLWLGGRRITRSSAH